MGLWIKCPKCQASNPLYLQVCAACGQSLIDLPREQRVYVIGPAEAALAPEPTLPPTPPAAPEALETPAAAAEAPVVPEVPEAPTAPPPPVEAAPKAVKKAKRARKKKT
jgi:hypothetical protein